MLRFLGILLLLGLARLSALTSPAAPDSGESNVHAGPDGTLHLTWCAPGIRAGERALYLSRLRPGSSRWTEPRLIVSTPHLMENWADFASLTVTREGILWAQWFQQTPGEDDHGYGGWLARSADGGDTWSEPAPLGHEFVSLAPLSGGRVIAVWLESIHPPRPASAPRPDRVTPKPGQPTPPSMRLRSRLLGPAGDTLRDWVIDPDVCNCCQTSLTTLNGDRVFVAYRGRTPMEIRDHRRAVFDGQSWGLPSTLHDDAWTIAACPVNGPASDARGDALAVAWFTMAGGVPRVQAKLSTDGGITFGSPLPIDLGKPIGRLELVALPDRSAVVIWMESKSGDTAAGIYARRIFPNGTLSAAELLADSSQARSSGFPRAAVRPNGRVALTWTQPGEPTQVRVKEWDPSTLGHSAAILSPLPRSDTPSPEICYPTESAIR